MESVNAVVHIGAEHAHAEHERRGEGEFDHCNARCIATELPGKAARGPQAFAKSAGHVQFLTVVTRSFCSSKGWLRSTVEARSVTFCGSPASPAMPNMRG